MTQAEFKALVGRSGLKQFQVAEMLHTTGATVSRWLAGKQPISGLAAVAIKDLLALRGAPAHGVRPASVEADAERGMSHHTDQFGTAYVVKAPASDVPDYKTSGVPDHEVIHAMRVFGGGFVNALAEAAGRADPVNLALIRSTWPELWAQYAEMCKQVKW